MTILDDRRDAILRRLPPQGRMAEVGVLVGRLSEALLLARPDIHLTMVDSWQPAEAQPEAYKATRDEHAFHDGARADLHRREAEARAMKFPDRAEIVATSSIAAAAVCPDHWFDLVFLDADHSEEGLRADLAAWLPKVKAGGWIGGHDYDNGDPRFDFSGVKRAVDAWVKMPELDANFTWWARV